MSEQVLCVGRGVWWLACAACGGDCRPVWAVLALVLGTAAVLMLRWVVTGREIGDGGSK